jgi:NADPH-dependent ferric siderophore reductase
MTVAAETELRLPDPRAAFHHLAAHIAEHGIEPEQIGPDALGFEYDGARIELFAGAGLLRLRLSARSENLLYFLKEGAATHVAEIDPVGAEALVWSDGVVTARPPNLHVVTLLAREEAYPGMVRLTFGADRAAALAADGLHAKLLLPARPHAPVWPQVAPNGVTRWPGGEDALHVRYFTLRRVDVAAGRVVVDVHRHPGGAVSDWAAAAQPGERIGLMGPGGGSAPRVRGRLLLAGDETALPAIARILEELGPQAEGTAVVALPEGVPPDAYLPAGRMRVVAVPAARFDAAVIEVLRGVEAPAYAWFGGEHRTAQAVRALFKGEWRLGKGAQVSVTYWRRGVAGDARREED